MGRNNYTSTAGDGVSNLFKIDFCIKKDHVRQLFESSSNISSYTDPMLSAEILRSMPSTEPCPMDTHRVEPLLGTSFLTLTQELPSKAMPGSAVSVEGISVKIYPAQ